MTTTTTTTTTSAKILGFPVPDLSGVKLEARKVSVEETATTKGKLITPPTEMTYQDRLIIKDTCDKIIRCMSQFRKYTTKQLMNDEYLYDYDDFEDYKESTSIPIYSYRNENPLDGLLDFRPTTPNDDYAGNKGSIIILYNYKDTRVCEYDSSWGFPVRRITNNETIYNAVFACELFYKHFNKDGVELLKGAVAQMLLEEYDKEPVFYKNRSHNP